MAPKDRYDSPSPDRRHDEERIVTPPPKPPPRPFPLGRPVADMRLEEGVAALSAIAESAAKIAESANAAARRIGRIEIALRKPQDDDNSVPAMRAALPTHPDGEWHTQTSRNEIVNEQVAAALEKARFAESEKEEAERKRAEERYSDRRWAIIVAIITVILAIIERVIETAAKGHL